MLPPRIGWKASRCVIYMYRSVAVCRNALDKTGRARRRLSNSEVVSRVVGPSAEKVGTLASLDQSYAAVQHEQLIDEVLALG